MREAVARALCEHQIRRVRRFDTDPEKLEAMMKLVLACPDCPG